MLYVDIPTAPEIKELVTTRADACVSIYLPTTPLTQEIGAATITLRNLAKTALEQLRKKGLDKRRISAIKALLDDLESDRSLWAVQAHSLAVLVTPDRILTYRLPNRLREIVEVSDRFHLKPLLRAVTFPHNAFVLALAENKVRLIEVSADLPGQEIKIKDMPKTAAAAVKRASVNDRSPSGRLHGSEGQEVLLRQFCRIVDTALRPMLAGRTTPLILAAADPLGPIFRSVSSYPHLLAEGIRGNMERVTPGKIVEAVRPILDAQYAQQVAEIGKQFEVRAEEGRATSDMADAARAATFGAIQTLLVDIDEVVPGTVDEQSGALALAREASASSYGVVDEIAGRALLSGAQVLAVRKSDIPGGASLAAILRYPLGG